VPAGSKPPRQPVGLGGELIRRDHAIDNAQAPHGRRIHGIGEQQQFHRLLVTGEAWQEPRRTAIGTGTDAAVGQRELRTCGRQHQIAGEHDADAGPGDSAMYRSDHRLRRAPQRKDAAMQFTGEFRHPLRSSARRFRNKATSPPATNAGPAPHSTTTRALRSPAARSQAARNSRRVAASSAFITAGR